MVHAQGFIRSLQGVRIESIYSNSLILGSALKTGSSLNNNIFVSLNVHVEEKERKKFGKLYLADSSACHAYFD